MMTESGLNEQARVIAEVNGISVQRAAEFLAFIGDTPELADDGKVIVRDVRGTEIARVFLPTEN